MTDHRVCGHYCKELILNMMMKAFENNTNLKISWWKIQNHCAFVSVYVCTGEQRNNMVNIELTILSVHGQTEIQDMMYKLLNK